ncbi:cytochrome P450 [Amycolatopsis pithecellobii]|uniref:Cytochrome P450 n=1 Tax=Amycolatopsis pithecellobii TaxID=664692 RepID=A0A6N7Z9E1_9PSEU|nr:cytochrome P450 [Amycolatopsis pithecellobii]MTD58358.1 cytochrome P450 [Amycolatopsis pithecellobii]
MQPAEDLRTRPEIRPNTNALEFDPTLATLLESAPVTRVTLPYGHDGPWLVSRYADIQAVTNDKRLSRAPLGKEVEIPRLMPAFVPPPDAVQLQDAPKASHLQEAMGMGITSRRMAKFRPVAEAIVGELLDRIAGEPGPVDLLEALTGRYPLDVMARLIGIPESDLADIRAWTRLMFSIRPEETEQTLAAKKALGEYSAGLVHARKDQPGNDLLSRIVADPDGKFSVGAMVGMTVQLIAVGIAPSNSLLSNICYQLLTDDRLAGIRADPGTIVEGFDELARFTPVIHGFGPPVVATTDLELGGVTIKRGEVLVYSYTSGNRDENAFPNPEEIDLHRKDAKHLTFGAGVHACVAQHFTKLVVTTAVQALLTRFPDVRLAVSPDEVDWDNGTIWRGPAGLPVLLHG